MTTIKIETPKCFVCRESSFVDVDIERLKRWQGGEHVQIVWADQPADWRELLITGTHSKCWDKMFADDNE